MLNGHKLIYGPFKILMIFLKRRNPIHLGFRHKFFITTGIFLVQDSLLIFAFTFLCD